MSVRLSDEVHTTSLKKTVSIENMLSTRGGRLRFVRKMTGMVTESFSALCGVGRTTISSWEQGINPLTEKGAAKVVHGVRSEGIHCTTLWLLHNFGESPKFISQSRRARPNKLVVRTSVEEEKISYKGSDLAKEIELFKIRYAQNLVYRIDDNTMHPEYREGDWVGGTVLSQESLDLAHDMDCIVQLRDGTTVARRAQVESTDTFKVSLYGTNAQSSITHPPFRYLLGSQLSALAPITRIWRNNLQIINP